MKLRDICNSAGGGLRQLHPPVAVRPQPPSASPTRRPRRSPPHMNPQQPDSLVGSEHLDIAEPDDQLVHAPTVTVRSSTRQRTEPILGDPSTSDADTHRPHPDLKRGEPLSSAHAP